MPRYHAISLSIVSHLNSQVFPEILHPDSSQVKSESGSQVCSHDDSDEDVTTSSTSSLQALSKADKVLGRSPAMSVYIPSVPGTRFYLRYYISPPHYDSEQYYFKLFMNGQHVNSWGVNPRTQPKGQVTRALFEANTIVHGHSCPESRALYFATDDIGKRKSAGDDGGLIEILVFRALGKRRIVPELNEFRQHDKYGISFPSSGLLDNPQDSRFYEWLLKDPKDTPYVAFRFHYRSWESLEYLQLISDTHPRTLLQPKADEINSLGKRQTGRIYREAMGSSKDFDEKDTDDNLSILSKEISTRAITFSQICNQFSGQVINEDADDAIHSSESRESDSDPLESESARKSQQDPKRKLQLPVSKFSMLYDDLIHWKTERPLPILPSRKEPFSHPNNSSVSSLAPSITPSLLPWIDRDAEDVSPEPILGVAAMVPVSLSRTPLFDAPDDQVSPLTFNSDSLSLRSSISPMRSIPSRIQPPPGAIFLPPNIMDQKTRFHPQKHNENKFFEREGIESCDEDVTDPFCSLEGSTQSVRLKRDIVIPPGGSMLAPTDGLWSHEVEDKGEWRARHMKRDEMVWDSPSEKLNAVARPSRKRVGDIYETSSDNWI